MPALTVMCMSGFFRRVGPFRARRGPLRFSARGWAHDCDVGSVDPEPAPPNSIATWDQSILGPALPSSTKRVFGKALAQVSSCHSPLKSTTALPCTSSAPYP